MLFFFCNDRVYPQFVFYMRFFNIQLYCNRNAICLTFISHCCIIISLSCRLFWRFNYTTKQTDTQYLFGKEYPFFSFLGRLNEPAPFCVEATKKIFFVGCIKVSSSHGITVLANIIFQTRIKLKIFTGVYVCNLVV